MTEHRLGDIAIRPFDADRDSGRVQAIVRAAWAGAADDLMEQQFGPIGGRPWSGWLSQAVLAYLKADGARSFVAERNGNVVGFCSYVIDEARGCGTVGYNAVAPDHQGLGIGSAMLDFVLSGMRAEGMTYAGVIVADNEQHLPARRNYAKRGFRRLTGYDYLVQKL